MNACLLLVLIASTDGAAAARRPVRAKTVPAAAKVWYFAVSGDSRDCGDLIMPKIAASIQRDHGKTPAAFYWHLGDFRRMFDTDCDILKRQHPDYDCKARPSGILPADAIATYRKMAWDDFIEHQVKAFQVPVFLGIGNHELPPIRSRDDYRAKFKPWLTQDALEKQRKLDAPNHIPTPPGSTYFHFVKNGVDFISLDNADRTSFSPDEVEWLEKVLEHDYKDPAVKTIIAGMHEALPFSTSSNHAMDISCTGICTGQHAYDLLYRAQKEFGKKVYVLASHSHYFHENIYDTPQHQGKVLPGWIIGTAGAEQYQQTILYGYLLVGVHPDGTITTQYKEVTRDSLPLASGPGGAELTDYCFTQNKIRPGPLPSDATTAPCNCTPAK